MPDVVVCLVYHTQWLQYNAFEKPSIFKAFLSRVKATLPTLWITSSRIQVKCQNDMRPSQESKCSMENPGGLGDVPRTKKGMMREQRDREQKGIGSREGPRDREQRELATDQSTGTNDSETSVAMARFVDRHTDMQQKILCSDHFDYAP